MSAQPQTPVTELDVRRPFTRAQALARGITPQQLRSGRYRRLHTGIYVSADVEVTPLLAARAALVPFGPAAWASHSTAGRYWRLPLPPLPGEHVTVVDKRERRSRSGIVCHYAADGVVREVDSVRISSPEQTFVELGSQLPLVELVVVGDFLVRQGIGLRRLREFCHGARGPGAAQARAAVAFVRDRVDSPMETRLRMLIVLAGLPEPLVNVTIEDANGVPCRRYDLCWPEARLVVEYDGRHHAERPGQWEADLRRREAIEDDGWRIVVLVARDVYTTPGETLARIHRLLKERGQTGVPARLRPGWEAHFPGRR